MRFNKVRSMWKAGKPVVAGWCGLADTYSAEVMATAGFDVLVLDMQHGMTIGPDRAGVWLQAVSTTPTAPFVRVPWNEPVYMQWVLDAGAHGVIVPLVNTAEEAAKAGGACRYAPQGFRSVGPNRARLQNSDYGTQANDDVVCLVMIESVEAVANIDAIGKAPGIDGFYIGPVDLGVSMGLTGGYQQDQRHAAACQTVLDAAKRHGLVAGVHCMGPEEAVQRFKQGFRFCPIAQDTRTLAAGNAAALRVVKDAGVNEAGP